MTTWKVARLTKTCALSGRPLPPDAPIVAALFGLDEEVSDDKVRGAGLVRKDFLVEGNAPDALDAAMKDAFCTWHTKTAPENPGKARRLDMGFAKELFERMRAEGDPTRAPVAWTLAMLLLRKKQIRLIAERDGEMELRWPGDDQPSFRVPVVVVTDAEQEALQQELARLFEF
jgi:hypothetical protein